MSPGRAGWDAVLPIRTVVVGVAGLHPDDPRPKHAGEDPVLEPAVALAASLGATLHVVHVFSLPQRVLAARGGRALSRTRYAGAMEEQLRMQVARHPTAPAIHCHAVEGSPGARLAGFARDAGADLLIVGASRRGRAWRGILGSTATEVLHLAGMPVLVVHEPFARPVARVLAAVDLSPASRWLPRRAVSLVREIFPGVTQSFRAVHVVSCDPLLPAPFPEWELESAARGEMQRLVSTALQGCGPVEVGVRSGEPALELTREAEEWRADLLVMGTHDPDSNAAGALGGTAAATLRHAACNVLVIPAAHSRRRAREALRVRPEPLAPTLPAD